MVATDDFQPSEREAIYLGKNGPLLADPNCNQTQPQTSGQEDKLSRNVLWYGGEQSNVQAREQKSRIKLCYNF